MDEFIHWPKPYLLVSKTCGRILSWMVEIWMKTHLVSVSNCNTGNLYHPRPPHTFFLQGMKNKVGLTFSVGNSSPWLTIGIEQDN